jgi:hypothetical protein
METYSFAEWVSIFLIEGEMLSVFGICAAEGTIGRNCGWDWRHYEMEPIITM